MVQPTYPGIYIQEKSSGPGPITGVSTSNMGLVGFTTRGRTSYPVLCTSFADYVAKFGSFTGSGLAPTMAYAFFANGGQRLYMDRAVGSGAVDGSVFWYKTISNEVLTNVAQVTGKYTLDTNKVPVVPNSVRVEFEAAVTNNIFEDNGAGVMSFVVAGSGGGGGSGSIDYESGEIVIQLTVPGNYVGGGGGANDVTAMYDYKVATFQMQWPGVAGNLFRVRVTGSPDYYTQATASYAAYKVMVEENIAAVGAPAVWQTNETFDEVVLDDATDPKYFKTIMNDVYKGSQIVTVIDYGNAQDIADLNGVAVTGEDFSGAQVPAYNGTVKQFVYTMVNPVAPGTLESRFKFREILYRVGTGDGTANPACNPLTYPIDLGDGSQGGAAATVNLNLSIAGASVLWDNGAGSLRLGAAPGVAYGTITYTTGAVVLACAGGNVVVAGTQIQITANYEDVVTVADDGNGAMAVQTPAVGTTPPTKFQLNSSGINTIDYDTGEMTLTWKIVGSPANGPAGVGASTGPTAAFKVGAAEPYAMTPAAHFDLDVNNTGILPCTWDASAGYQIDSTVYPVANQIGLTVIISIDGVSQTVLFVGATTSAQHVINEMNAQLVGAYAIADGAFVKVVSDTKGLASSVLRTGGTSALAWVNPAVPGAGDVQDITAVTALEIEAVIEADTTALVTVNPDGTFTIFSPTTGITSELDFSSALAAIGISVEVIIGSAGAVTGGETADYYTQPDDEEIYVITGGLDGAATTRADVTAAALAAGNEGVYALKLADEIMQVVIADFQTDDAVCRDVITFCENMGDKFGIFTVPEGLDEQEAVNWRKFTLAQYSDKAALYFPHIRITDPVTNSTTNIPDGGHVAGVYARTDNNKNVGKAPAGVEDGKLLWLEGLENDLSRPQVGYAYENKVNCLVSWPQTGMAVWGARTLTAPGGEFVYINQRRLFQFVEKSVFNSTHIHVFQNNGPALWASIRLQVTNFLLVLFKAGYFAGTTPDEAFFVICDETNNPQQTVDLGLVYCDVGLATNKPAEFVIFSFSQKAVK